jgi:hypothetical protein
MQQVRGTKFYDGLDTFSATMIAEGVEEATSIEQLAAWQYLIDTNTVWNLQGFFGRTAQSLIEMGYCQEKIEEVVK